MAGDGGLRFYWSRRMRAVWALAAVNGTLAMVAVTVTATPWWSALPFDVFWPFVLVSVLRMVRHAGVRETRDGLLGRIGRYSSECAWADITAFGSVSDGLRQIVFAQLTDGSRSVIRGARRRMHWHGGHTTDFAAVLEERRLLFCGQGDHQAVGGPGTDRVAPA